MPDPEYIVRDAATGRYVGWPTYGIPALVDKHRAHHFVTREGAENAARSLPSTMRGECEEVAS